MKKSNLAVVIPAYKATFLNEALESIANQTCKDFKVYIGDDKSPYDLEAIINPYRLRLDITYKKFNQNLGGANLVHQWERCIDLIGDEDWIWLFSDDDTMSPNCVENFYRQISNEPRYDIYHFDVNIIDDKGNTIVNAQKNAYPQILDSYTFYKKRVLGSYPSFVVEYIFNKKKFYEVNRFQDFDLAWSSDVATWIKISDRSKIFTIQNSYVNWRRSNENISPDNSQDIVIRKVNSVVDFLVWSNKYFSERKKNINFFNFIIVLKRLKYFYPYISNSEINKSIHKYSDNSNYPKLVSGCIKLALNINKRLAS